MQIRSLGSAVLASLALATAACGASPTDSSDTSSVSAAASTATPNHNPAYLALGDSVAFGDDGYIPWTLPNSTVGNPARACSAEFVGYPYFVAARRKTTDARTVTDLGCPGETTGSFLSATAPDNGCREYKNFGKGDDGAWLHTSYSGTQMTAALAYLKANKVDLVTINLGGNDLLLAEYACATAANPTTCIEAALPGVITTAATNVATIMGTLRGAGYTGTVVFLTQYATSYTDPTQVGAIPPFNAAISSAVKAYGGIVADGYGEFSTASTATSGNACTAGLLIPNPDGGVADGCDKHPSPKGANDLATAILTVLP